jgi:multiple sugar transport system ATP-binding protein
VAQVVLENIYKTFPPRRGRSTLGAPNHTPNQAPNQTPNQTAAIGTPQGQKAQGNTVLRRINLTIEDGEFLVLVGPSGCGKSTLLRLIAGLESMSAGKIWVGEHLVNDLAPKDRDIAMVFQSYALYPHLTVYDNLAFGLRRTPWRSAQNQALSEPSQLQPSQLQPSQLHRFLSHGPEALFAHVTRFLPRRFRYLSRTERQIQGQVQRVAQMLQIESLLDRLPRQLSGGQKQRVALGRAIARNSQVFLMDEPLSNLDAKLRAETRAQIVGLQRQLATTTVYVTHDQVEAMTMGQRIAVMNGGQIQQVASPMTLYRQPKNRFVAGFIGSPPMNFLSVQVQPPATLRYGNCCFPLAGDWQRALQSHHHQILDLGIRPQHLVLQTATHPPTEPTPTELTPTEPSGTEPTPSLFQGQVELIEALGSDTYIQVALMETDDRIQVRLEPDQPIALGDRVQLIPQLDQIHLFRTDTGEAIRPLREAR